MTPELTVLALAVLLQVVQMSVYSWLANMQVGPHYSLGPRDEPRMLNGRAGRSQRAVINTFESLVLFAIAVTVTVLGDKTTGLSAACAWIFLGARVLYFPAYIFGLSPWRTLIWSVGLGATTLMILGALLF